MGIGKTITKIKQHYDFLGIKPVVELALAECDLYGRSKPGRYKPYELLQPLLVAEQPWSSVTMDFITKLPISRDLVTGIEYDSILTMVDRLTK